jgi:phosphatidate cytidylyltransferase
VKSDADRPLEAAGPAAGAKPAARELGLRVASALLMAPVAVGIAYWGGWPFAIFWAAAALLVLWEWTGLVSGEDRRGVLIAGAASILLAVVLAVAAEDAQVGTRETRVLGALTVLAMGMLGTAALSPRTRRLWIAGGIPYAGLLATAPIVLRSDPNYGFVAIVFVFAIVWATDILAYFCGRAFGGPKLAPRISPKKTWSGAIGGTAAAVVAALAIAGLAGVGRLPVVALVAAVLSGVAQAGDLFESALKRRFGAKDSSHLIPGHGGLMDRLDGFLAASVLAALIGVARGGLEEPARGLLVW